MRTTYYELQQALETEFCPRIDATLIAAMLGDICSPKDGHVVIPDDALTNLRMDLSQFAQEAEIDDPSLFLSPTHSSMSHSSTVDETESSQGFSVDTMTSSHSSTYQTISLPSHLTPASFLHAAFPHMKDSRLLEAMNGLSNQAMTMTAIVEELLSEELIKELEERGIEDDMGFNGEQTITAKTKSVAPKHKAAKNRPVVAKIHLGDVRQQPQRRSKAASNQQPAAFNPWAQVSSFATYLNSLISSRPPEYFSSFFHDPKYSTPSIALRAALSSAVDERRNSDDSMALFSLLDLLCSSPEYETLTLDGRTQLASDAQLALVVTNGAPNQALDIVWFLRDLDTDAASVNLAMGIYHSSPPTPSNSTYKMMSTAISLTKASSRLLSSVDDNIPPPPRPPANVHTWQTVPPRSRAPKQTHTHAEFIPALNPNNVPKKFKGSGNTIGKSGKGDIGELRHKKLMAEYQRKRGDALREASRHWQRGTTKTRGGEVAFYFAQRAREYQEKSRLASLDVARELVEQKRSTSQNDAIDLHGTTVDEAITIVREVLDEGWVTPSRPLRIITGRGSHSTNRVGVLGPAIKKVLNQDGWNVDTWSGGLTVGGKT